MTHTTEQLEAMLAAATPGRWDHYFNFVCADADPIAKQPPRSSPAARNWEANAALISAAPTITAELIAARKRIASLEDALVGIKRASRARMLSYGDEHSYYYHTAHAALGATP